MILVNDSIKVFLMDLTSWVSASSISIVYLVTAVLLRIFAPGNNNRIRRVAYFCLLYLLSVVVFHLAQDLTWSTTASVVDNVAFFFAWLTLMELLSIIVLKVMMPRFGIHAPSIITELYFAITIVVLIILTLRNFGVDATSIAATSAVVTGIVAIGSQATLGNVIGGIALQLDRSIRIGDWIQLENGQQGKIQEICWRHTVVETRNWDTIIVPNTSLLAANIIILGKRDGEPLQHRMWVYFTVDFRTNPAVVIDTVDKAIQAKPTIIGIAQSPKPNCICMDFAEKNRESYAVYAVRYWLTQLKDDDPTSSLVRLRLYAALQRAGIPFAIPAAQLFIDNDTNERRERKDKINLEKRIEALDKIEFLQVLNEDEHLLLAKDLQPVLFSKGENIMVQNDQAHWLYILTEGSVEVWVSAKQKKSKVDDLYAPTFFGEMGLMTGAPRSATIVASTDVYCYRLYREGFQKILQRRPIIAEEISVIMAKRQVETQSIRTQLDEGTHNQRVEEVSHNLLANISSFFGLDV